MHAHYRIPPHLRLEIVDAHTVLLLGETTHVLIQDPRAAPVLRLVDGEGHVEEIAVALGGFHLLPLVAHLMATLARAGYVEPLDGPLEAPGEATLWPALGVSPARQAALEISVAVAGGVDGPLGQALGGFGLEVLLEGPPEGAAPRWVTLDSAGAQPVISPIFGGGCCWRCTADPRRHIPERWASTDEIAWSPVWPLDGGPVAYAPTAYCFSGTPRGMGRRFCPFNPNGHAAGNTFEEAALQGFLEAGARASWDQPSADPRRR